MDVTLDLITEDNVGAVLDLDVTEEQRDAVAPNAHSLAQAYAEYDIAWPRAIVAAGEVVGFLMLEIDPHEEDGRPYWLWRLMVDAKHQHRGYGCVALELACEHLRTLGATELFTSWIPGEHGPGGFYRRLGFEPTGEVDDGEVVARLGLAAPS